MLRLKSRKSRFFFKEVDKSTRQIESSLLQTLRIDFTNVISTVSTWKQMGTGLPAIAPMVFFDIFLELGMDLNFSGFLLAFSIVVTNHQHGAYFSKTDDITP